MRIDSLTRLKKKVSISLILELVGCGDPGMPVHGYKTGANYWAGQMVTFTCDTRYHLEGPTNRLCQENGNWSDVAPTCDKMKSLIQYLYLSFQ